jgi:hypothetical protein
MYDLASLLTPPAQGWGYTVVKLDDFLLTIFDKYAELLQRKFSDEFLEVSIYSIAYN